MAPTRPVGELRERAKGLILEKLKNMPISQASRDLGISRQAIYGFKKGEYCPSLAIVERACKVWGLEFPIQGISQEMTVNRDSFTRHSISAVNKSAEQLTMEHLWKQLENRPMTVVSAKKENGVLEMVLRVPIPA